ncbi:MAG: VCBS repeat-containing protein [Polyangiaceae bacterium]|nr:VCBS repeat-containing protein [Polyangiaceae bacterium]
MRESLQLAIALGQCALFLSCSANPPSQSTTGQEGGSTSSTTGGTGGAQTSSATTATTGGYGGSINPNMCGPSDQTGIATCADKAPPNAFTPIVEWEWAIESGSITTPMVGNFTDDNGDGQINLCDVPDVVVVDMSGIIHVLSGDTGVETVTFQQTVQPNDTAAFADIDGDGNPEVVAVDYSGSGLIAFEHDGTVKWFGEPSSTMALYYQCGAVGIYDLDGDGAAEIAAFYQVFSADGSLLWEVPGGALGFPPGSYYCPTTTAADLDGDGKQELLFGHATYHSDGTLYFELPNHGAAHPHVANIDADPEPEIILTSAAGVTVVEANGTVKFGPVRPTGEPPAGNCWGKPLAIHDFDGDGQPEVAVSSCTTFGVYEFTETGLEPIWAANVVDESGLSSSTAFDFLGDGTAEAIYGDEYKVYVFDGKTGTILMSLERSSGTLVEYPVVADIDNDGSAEIILVGNYPHGLVALGDAEDRWIQARRIWNQHASYVTNIREDGTLPTSLINNWEGLNTFRCNAQIEGNQVCDPAQ